LNFGFGETLDALRDTVHRFAQAEIAPRAAAVDANNVPVYHDMDDYFTLGANMTYELFETTKVAGEGGPPEALAAAVQIEAVGPGRYRVASWRQGQGPAEQIVSGRQVLAELTGLGVVAVTLFFMWRSRVAALLEHHPAGA